MANDFEISGTPDDASKEIADLSFQDTQGRHQKRERPVTSVEVALFELLRKYERPDLYDDVRDYVKTGRLNRRLERQLDTDPVCQRVMDVLFEAQIATIHQVNEVLLRPESPGPIVPATEETD